MCDDAGEAVNVGFSCSHTAGTHPLELNNVEFSAHAYKKEEIDHVGKELLKRQAAFVS